MLLLHSNLGPPMVKNLSEGNYIFWRSEKWSLLKVAYVWQCHRCPVSINLQQPKDLLSRSQGKPHISEAPYVSFSTVLDYTLGS